jgi:hypothetical protein
MPIINNEFKAILNNKLQIIEINNKSNEYIKKWKHDFFGGCIVEMGLPA